MSNRFAFCGVSVALLLASASAAVADRLPNADERAAIEKALRAAGYTSWGKIELDDGRAWEVDNAVAADGKRYDLDLDMNLSIVKKDIED